MKKLLMNRAVACSQAVNPNNLSYFILPVGKFINVVARWPGSTHDSHSFRTSNIGRQLERTNFENGVLIGDSGYACLPYLMTPYPEPQTPPQRRFNRALRITRSIIERTFGILKQCFHVLHSEVRMTPERVCARLLSRRASGRPGTPSTEKWTALDAQNSRGKEDF